MGSPKTAFFGENQNKRIAEEAARIVEIGKQRLYASAVFQVSVSPVRSALAELRANGQQLRAAFL